MSYTYDDTHHPDFIYPEYRRAQPAQVVPETGERLKRADLPEWWRVALRGPCDDCSDGRALALSLARTPCGRLVCCRCAALRAFGIDRTGQTRQPMIR